MRRDRLAVKATPDLRVSLPAMITTCATLVDPTLQAFLHRRASSTPGDFGWDSILLHMEIHQLRCCDPHRLDRLAASKLALLSKPIKVVFNALERPAESVLQPLSLVFALEDTVAERQHHVSIFTAL